MKTRLIQLISENQFAAATASFLLLIFIYGRWVETQWIDVTYHSVSGRFGLNEPLKIAQVSDLHIRALGQRETRILSLLEREKPDAILVTGDLVAENSNHRAVGDFLAQLHAPLGVWVINGNWEHWRPDEHEKIIYKLAGVRHLLNSAQLLTGSIWLVGVDDEYAGAPDLKLALRDVPKNAYRIGLFHSPAFFNKSFEKFNLALSGHTHGGQIRLPFFPPLWLPDGSGQYVEGWYTKGPSKMYVSRGLGNSILDFRLFCRPELVILHLIP